METPNYAYRLRKNQDKVLKDLEPGKILNFLYQEEVFELDDMDEVKSGRTRKKQAEILLGMLVRSGDQSMRKFVHGLQKTQRHLYELLQVPVPGEERAQGDQRIIDLTGQLHTTSLNTHQEFFNQSNNALSPTEMLPRKIGNTEKGAAYYQTSDAYLETPPDEICGFVKPIDRSKIPPHIHPDSELVYPMTSKPRGIALIINNESFADNPEMTEREKQKETLDARKGSNSDVQSLEKLYEALDFKVRTEKNKTRQEILKILDEVSHQDHRQYDCFVLWLMSHGQNGLFYGTDGDTVPIETVRDFFTNAKCPSLKGKPKVIFIQACRGREREKGVVSDAPNATVPQTPQPSTNDDLSGSTSGEATDKGFNFQLNKTIADHADILIANSTISGYAAFRNPLLGSRFVRCVVEVFQEMAGYEEILGMLTEVNKRVSEMGEINEKQVSEPTSTLRKKLYFWPGF